jgi:hypothetical protein
MGGGLRALLVTGVAAVALVLCLPAPSASAAPSTVGFDVSHPQCGGPMPTGQAFGIVGVNGGRATTANPCLPAQLRWAWRSSGAATGAPRAQLYVNTANPGELRDRVSTWPSAGSTPYGACNGRNTTACSWQYGWERARTTVSTFFGSAARSAGVDATPSHYTWWLDVETANTWQSGSAAARARNRAALEGMAAYLIARGAPVGLYAVPAQWRQITGRVPSSSNLHRLDSWLPGAETRRDAWATCDQEPLTAGGDVVLTQYVSGGLDRNVACR